MSLPVISSAPAREGFEWLAASIRIFRSQWLRYTSIAALFLLFVQITIVISGGVLFVFLKPVLTVGFLAAAWHHERGELPEPKHLFAGFKSNLRALLPLGALYLVAGFIAASLAMASAGVTSEQLLASNGQPTLSDEQRLRFMLVGVLLTLPVTAALWFSPALIVFSDASLGQSIALSVKAFVRNLLPILCYAIALLLLIIAMAAVVAPIAYLAPGVLVVLGLLFAAPFTAVVMISDYVIYRRVFHRDEAIARVA